MYLRGPQHFPRPSRILLIQLRRIGDTLLGTPALRALGKHFPDAEIDFVAESPAEEVLRGHPRLSRLLVAPRHGLRETYLFVKLMRECRYDWAIDFMSNPRSAQFAFLSGAKVRVGLSRRGRKWAFTHHVVEEETDRDCYAVDLRLRILQQLGVPPAGRELEIFCDNVSSDESAHAKHVLSQFHSAKPLVAVAVGSANPAKRYPSDLTAQVISRLYAEGFEVVLTAGPDEASFAEEIMSLLDHNVAHILSARVPLLAALYRNCNLCIGPDSAPKHIAVACGLPTITLFGPGRPSNWNDDSNPRSVMLVAPCEIRPNCVEADCARFGCLRRIEPDTVIRTARDLLKM
jgi:ADP-heptose:LPS heptosyltransferase